MGESERERYTDDAMRPTRWARCAAKVIRLPTVTNHTLRCPVGVGVVYDGKTEATSNAAAAAAAATQQKPRRRASSVGVVIICFPFVLVYHS